MGKSKKILGTKACIAQRYVLSIMGFLAITVAYTMRVSLSVAIVQMVGNNHSDVPEDPNACPYPGGGGVEIIQGEFDWSEETVGLILSSFYWGYLITHLPGGILAEKWGGKYLLSGGILSTAIFSFLSPLMASAGTGWFIGVRVLMGLGEGTTFPALNVLLANWIPPQERGFLGSMVFAGSQIGTVVGTALSGVLIEAWGWESVFYFFGGCGVVWVIIFTLICYNNPEQHPFIRETEREYLKKELSATVDSKVPPTPWRDLVRSVPLWGLVCAQIGHDWGFYTLTSDLPLFMSDVLHFDISTNGLLSSLPYLVMWIVSMISGWISDWIIRRKLISTTNARKLFTTVASVGPSVGMMIASYIGCDATLVIVIFTIFLGSMGAYYPGMKINPLDLSPNYAGTLMAIVNGAGAVTGIITPYIVGVITINHTMLEWRTVFWIVFGILNFTNVIFLLTASGEVQYWNWGKTSDKLEPSRENVGNNNAVFDDNELKVAEKSTRHV